MSTRDTQSASAAQRPRPLARMAALLSLRTISGRLIIGLVVLFGLASIIVSVITTDSLNNSLMSSLNTELQAASMRWRTVSSRRRGTTPMPTSTQTRRLTATARPPVRSRQS